MAVQAGFAAYNQKLVTPRHEWGWDEYANRTARNTVYQSYLENTVYSIETFSGSLKVAHRLYRHIRPIYNPVARQNRLIVANVFQGSLDTKDMTRGALPLESDNQAIFEPLKRIYRWSNLGQQLGLYVHYAALYGNGPLWVVDDRQRQRVRLEVVHPSRIKDVQFDEVGNVKAVVFEYERDEEVDIAAIQPGRFGSLFRSGSEKTYTYTMKVTADRYETFKNGEPFAYYTDINGSPISSWENDYGFVPLKLPSYEAGDNNWGKNSFYNALGKINEINDAASILNDSIRNTVVPMLKALKTSRPTATSNGGIEFSSNDRDSMNIVYLSGEGQDLQPISIPLDIAAASANIQLMLKELRFDMPELALQDVSELVTNPTAPGVRMVLSDAIGSLTQTRKNLDPGIIGGLQMCITIGAQRGYEGFEAFNIGSYDRGDMELAVKERPVVPDSLSIQDRITSFAMVQDKTPALQRLMLQELDVDDDDIDAVVEEAEEAAEAQTRAAVRGLADSVFGENEDDDENTPPQIGQPAVPQLAAQNGA